MSLLVGSRRARFGGVVLLAVLLVSVSGAASPPASGAVTTLKTFKTPGWHKWTVPAGVTRVTFVLFGASGGNSVTDTARFASGGAGGETKATFAVKPSQVFQIVVGSRGVNGTLVSYDAPAGYGGGGSGQAGDPAQGIPGQGAGGGASDVRLAASGVECAASLECPAGTRIAVAGGGGGGWGLNATDPSGYGGAGGGVAGAPGGPSDYVGGGTQSAGGAGTAPWEDGEFGHAAPDGGGGGGWYGGGGSDRLPQPGYSGGAWGKGGGGGSGFYNAFALSGSFPTQVSPHYGDGLVKIQTG